MRKVRRRHLQQVFKLPLLFVNLLPRSSDGKRPELPPPPPLPFGPSRLLSDQRLVCSKANTFTGNYGSANSILKVFWSSRCASSSSRSSTPSTDWQPLHSLIVRQSPRPWKTDNNSTPSVYLFQLWHSPPELPTLCPCLLENNSRFTHRQDWSGL